MKKYLVVAGNIGAGKSTLVEQISLNWNWKPYFEPVSENPYLEDFYKDMTRWAFHSQLYFLTDRLKTHKELQSYGGSVVQDRSVHEDAEIFVRNLHQEGSLSDRDFQTYHNLYRVMSSFLEAPSLVVYLKCSVDTLKKRIARRGRSFEADIPDGYLENLNRLYDGWIEGYSHSARLIIDADKRDFVINPGDLEEILSLIEERLKGDQGELW